MELSLQKLNKEIKETQRERDKALQELTRLKQHLLQKVVCPLKCSIPKSFLAIFTLFFMRAKDFMYTCVSQISQLFSLYCYLGI